MFADERLFFEMAVFVLPGRGGIPLHDHPNSELAETLVCSLCGRHDQPSSGLSKILVRLFCWGVLGMHPLLDFPVRWTLANGSPQGEGR